MEEVERKGEPKTFEVLVEVGTSYTVEIKGFRQELTTDKLKSLVSLEIEAGNIIKKKGYYRTLSSIEVISKKKDKGPKGPKEPESESLFPVEDLDPPMDSLLKEKVQNLVTSTIKDKK